MMESSFEVLPLEIIELIAGYLSVNEILACCATSSAMRNVFSSDIVWKRKCNLKVVDYLRKSQPVVEPSFEWLEATDGELTNLSPLPEWRKHHMLQASLWNNWREGRFEKDQLEFGPSGADCLYTSTVRIYDNDFIFLHISYIFENGKLNEIWDIGGPPFLHSTLTMDFSEFLGCDVNWIDYKSLIEIVGNRLVVMHMNLVLIYEITIASFSQIPLLHAFIFNKSVDESQHLINRVKASKYNDGSFTAFSEVVMAISDHYVIGIVTSSAELNDVKLHIWDILTGKKIREEVVPIESGINIRSVQVIPSSDNKGFIVKLVVNRHRHMYHCYGYDILGLTFTSFLVKVNYCDFAFFNGKFVIGFSQMQLYSYDYDSSDKLATKNLNCHILVKSLTYVDNKILCGTTNNTVHVLSIPDLTIINTVKLEFTLYKMQGICNKFVVMNSVSSEVWEIGQSAKKLFRFPNDASLVAVNQYCTKLVIEKLNKLIIWNFW